MRDPGTLPDLRREQVLFAGLAAVYAIALGLLFASGNFGFVYKTLVVPSFFVIAWLARRFRGFVRDWSVFLGVVILFDSCRGIIYAAVRRLDLPVYMGYAIDAERALFAGSLPSLTLQRVLFADGQIGTMERSLVAVHASHFVVFLGFGLLVWLIRAEWFPRLTLSFILVMGLGIAGYLLVPTVPPWMAAERFQVLPDITHMSKQVYNVSLPAVAKSFDLNPIAAMPSLHAAFPTLLTLICFRLFRRWGIVMLAYCSAVVFAIVYMGEHYVVDILAGVALALAGYYAAFRWRPLTPWLDRAGRTAAGPAGHGALIRPVGLTAVLLALAILIGLEAERTGGGFVPNQRFFARELEGKSPIADYYRGALAFRGKNFRAAQPLLAGAIPAIRDSAIRARARIQLAESAFLNGDFSTAVNGFDGHERLSPRHVEMLDRARAELTQSASATPE
jgi:membrane-associated phospholipid phosphatase